MKHYSKAVAVLVLLVFAVASGSALARGGHGGGGHGGGHFGGGVRFGVNLGFPLFWPGYYPAPYYSYPAYAYPPAYAYSPDMTGYSTPPLYTEQGYAQAAPAPQQDWYFCAGSNAYYPYIRECPGGWQRVPAQPPR